jgi:hypothetical protein
MRPNCSPSLTQAFDSSTSLKIALWLPFLKALMIFTGFHSFIADFVIPGVAIPVSVNAVWKNKDKDRFEYLICEFIESNFCIAPVRKGLSKIAFTS